MHYLIMKIRNKIELENIAINYSADMDCKDFMKVCKKWFIFFLNY